MRQTNLSHEKKEVLKLRLWKNSKNKKLCVAKKMKKTISMIIVMIVIMTIAGCGSKNTEQTISIEEPEGKEAEPSTVKVYKQGETKTEEAPKPAMPGPSSLPREIKELFAKAEKISSVEYSYAEYELGTEGFYAQYAIKGDKVKVTFSKGQGKFFPGQRYNTVYIDISKGTAEGYCENNPNDCQDIGEAAAVLEPEGFLKETPFTLIDSVTEAEKTGTGMWDSKDTTMIERQMNGNKQKIWIWEYSGMPLKYEIYDENDAVLKKVEFKKMITNQVKDSELIH